jgi:hypothetical protein
MQLFSFGMVQIPNRSGIAFSSTHTNELWNEHGNSRSSLWQPGSVGVGIGPKKKRRSLSSMEMWTAMRALISTAFIGTLNWQMTLETLPFVGTQSARGERAMEETED